MNNEHYIMALLKLDIQYLRCIRLSNARIKSEEKHKISFHNSYLKRNIGKVL